jgi:hypothetical protein
LTTTPAKGGLGAVAIAGIVVAVLAALGVGSLGAVAIFAIAGAVGGPAAGDCLHITQGSGFERLSCRDSQAVFLVETRQEGGSTCPSDDYTRLRVTENDGTRYTLCLALNVSTGDCLTAIADDTKIAKVGCRTSQAEANVEVQTGDHRDACEELGGAGLLFEGPPVRTVCLTEVGESI